MSRSAWPRRGFSLLELMIVLAVIGLLTTIALPTFLRYRARARQSEAKANLRAVYVGQRVYFGERGRYTSDFRGTGFAPEAGNRYSYGMGTGLLCSRPMARSARESACIGQDAWRDDTPPSLVAAAISAEDVEAGEFVATAVGNVDGDGNADVWLITSQTRLDFRERCGTDVPYASAGEPSRAWDDVLCP